MADRPMWRCRDCGRRFAQRNQTHTCAPLGPLDAHFAASEPLVRETFDRFVDAARDLGEFEILPERTRIALHARMSFAALVPRRRWLAGHLVLARRVDSPRFRRIEVFGPTNVLHEFRLRSPDEVDEQFVDWLREAYRVGRQEHRRPAGA